jgi:heme exporter protein A
MLEAFDLAAQRGNTRLFSSLSFRVEPGSALFITGANGTGKTTLLRILAGLGAPIAGRVRWRDIDVMPFAPSLRQDALYSGHLTALKDELTAQENLAALVSLSGQTVEPAQIHDALAKVALERKAGLPARVLSQGQRRRVCLARMTLSRRPLWLLDEPATALDAEGIALLKQLLSAHLEGGGTALVATHQALDLPTSQFRALALS